MSGITTFVFLYALVQDNCASYILCLNWQVHITLVKFTGKKVPINSFERIHSVCLSVSLS